MPTALDGTTYEVSQVNGLYRITLADRTVWDQHAVQQFITTNTPQGVAMSEAFDTIRPEDQYRAQETHDLDSATTLIESHDPQNGCVQWIGKNARSMKEAQTAGRLWAQLHRTACLGTVTLDVDPERYGRPQALRPGTPQLQLIELPDWHHLFDGDGSVAVVYYVPVTTWIAKDEVIDEYGRPAVVPKLLASSSDPTGFIAVTKVLKFYGAEQADEWVAEMRKAVQTVAGMAGFDDPDELEARQSEALADKMRRLSAL